MSLSDMFSDLFSNGSTNGGSSNRGRNQGGGGARRTPEAVRVMRRLNDHALIGREGELFVFVEDCWDCESDQRMYRIEYQSTPDAERALAYCRHNPWGRDGDPKGGESTGTGHVFSTGQLCLDSSHTSTVEESPLDLEEAVSRARYWCTAFSVLKEEGYFPSP